MVHVLLKPGLENIEHYFASVWDACNRQDGISPNNFKNILRDIVTRDCIIETEKILEGNGLDLNKTLYSSDFLSGMAFDNHK